MNQHRHAGRAHGSSATWGGPIRVAAAVLTAALATVGVAAALVSLRMARKVVTPTKRASDTLIVDLDTSAQTITLTSTPDTRLPGRYGLFTKGTESYVKLGTVLAETDTTVTRKLLTQIDNDSQLDADAAFSGWYFDRPEQLHLPFSSELIGSPLGPCPAWLFPPADAEASIADTWVVQVHGRGTTRAETLRAVPVFRDLGMTSLLVSYRNDGEAPRSRAGTYSLGATEWRDVDAAVAFALRRGAKRIVLMGWSMGGAIVLQLALNSVHADSIVGIVLDSPVTDWRLVLGFQARELGVPGAVSNLALGALQSDFSGLLARTDAPIPFDKLDVVVRANELRHPMLILHSDDDGFVPSGGSHELAAERPDLVTLETFHIARHTKLWNYDQIRWSDTITSWLREQGLFEAPAVADS